MMLPKITPARPEDLEMLKKCVEADGHILVSPTFKVEKGPQVVGVISVLPSVLVWMDTQRTHVRDSVMVMNFFENHLRAGGVTVMGLPCKTDSPYFPLLEKVGYLRSKETTLFLKNIGG